MKYCNLLFFLSLILTSYFINYASSMNRAEVSSSRSGYQAVTSFIHNAVILAKQNRELLPIVIGNAFFIKTTVMISVAESFYDDAGELADIGYSAMFQGVMESNVEIRIEAISVYSSYHGKWSPTKYNVAVLHLTDSQLLRNNVNIADTPKLQLDESIRTQYRRATMSGYSPKNFIDISYPNSEIVQEVLGKWDTSLQHITVEIVSNNTVCAYMRTRPEPYYIEKLKHEDGIPIVLDNKILGFTIAKYWDVKGRFCYGYKRVLDHLGIIHKSLHKIVVRSIHTSYFKS